MKKERHVASILHFFFYSHLIKGTDGTDSFNPIDLKKNLRKQLGRNEDKNSDVKNDDCHNK